MGAHQIAVETVSRTIYTAALREKWGRQFAAYHKALKQREDAVHEATAALSTQQDWDEHGILRTSRDAIAAAIACSSCHRRRRRAAVEIFSTPAFRWASSSQRLRAAVERHCAAR